MRTDDSKLLAVHSAGNVASVAREWIGTPYHHQASRKGVGADCLGLVRGVYLQLYGQEAERPPAYTRDWAEASASETMLEAARRHLKEINVKDADEGDVLIFRLRTGVVAKHAGVLTGRRSMVHAMEGGPACEITLTPWWHRRIAAAFSFPGTQR